jgi:hypothetical protein
VEASAECVAVRQVVEPRVEVGGRRVATGLVECLGGVDALPERQVALGQLADLLHEPAPERAVRRQIVEEDGA